MTDWAVGFWVDLGFSTASTFALTGVQKQSEAPLLHVRVERVVSQRSLQCISPKRVSVSLGELARAPRAIEVRYLRITLPNSAEF